MKSEELLRVLSEVDEKYIEEAAEGNAAFAVRPKRRMSKKIVSIAACAAVLVIGASAVLRGGIPHFAKSAAPPEAAESMMSTQMAAPEEIAAEEEGMAYVKDEMKADMSSEPAEAFAEHPAAEEAEPEAAQQSGPDNIKTGEANNSLNLKENAPEKPSAAHDIPVFTSEYANNFIAGFTDDDRKAALKFTSDTIAAFIGENNGKNKLYSPVNAFLAVNTLAQLTDGNTRSQILGISGFGSAEDALEASKRLAESMYIDEEDMKRFAASSLWLDSSLRVNDGLVEKLREERGLASFVMDLGSEEALAAYKKWISEQTAGLLDDVADTGKFSDSSAVLAETLYYKAAWSKQFSAHELHEDKFRAADGDEAAVFMDKTENTRYFKGKDYAACGLSLTDGSVMWYVLADDESLPAEALIENGTLAEVISLSEYNFESVALRVPKIDVSSEISLSDGLKSLGVTDAFSGLADFSPLTPDSICVDDILHSVRVKTDENGVEAAALTQIFMKMTSAGPAEEPVYFICDRPFAFAIVSAEGAPLFAGVVNHVK